MAVFLRGSSYYIKIRRNGRQVLRSLDTRDKAEAKTRAKEFLRTFNGELDTAFDTKSRSGNDAPPETALAAHFEQFSKRVARQVENGHVRPSYHIEVEGLWKTHLSRFSDRVVGSDLDREVIEHLDRQALSVASRRKAHSLYRKLAALAGRIVPPYRFQSALPPKEKRPLTVAQLQSCKEECLSHPHPVAKLIYLAAVTGARIGEIMALTPADIGPDCVSISKTKCRKTGVVVGAKTRNSRRVIPVSPEILATVQPSIGYPGKEWFPVWRTIRKRAHLGIVGIHVLRHTWATNALGSGITPKGVSLALGHSTVTFTETQYARFLSADVFRAELAGFNR